MGEGDDLGHGRVKNKNMKEKKREMALWTCGVFSPDLKSAKSA